MIGMTREDYDRYDNYTNDVEMTNRVIELMKLENPIPGGITEDENLNKGVLKAFH